MKLITVKLLLGNERLGPWFGLISCSDHQDLQVSGLKYHILSIGTIGKGFIINTSYFALLKKLCDSAQVVKASKGSRFDSLSVRQNLRLSFRRPSGQ